MTGAVVLNGEKYQGEIKADIVVGVDGGYNNICQADVFIGDKDSVNIPVKCGNQILLNVDKDMTDGEYSVDYLIKKGVDTICFYGLAGGRVDHILANFALMARATANGVKTIAFCNDFTAYMIKDTLSFKTKVGTTISLSTFTDKSHIISMKGLKWQLNDEDILKTSSKTISNVAISDFIEINLSEGMVLVIENK